MTTMIRVTVHRTGYSPMASPPLVTDSVEHKEFVRTWLPEADLGLTTDWLTEYEIPVVVKVWGTSREEAEAEVAATIKYGMGGGFFINHDDVSGFEVSTVESEVTQ